MDVREVIRTSSFGNCWPCFEVIANLSTFLVIFRSCHNIFSNLWKLSEIFDDLRKSSKIFRNLRKPLVNLRKFRFWGDEKSHAFYWTKVGKYNTLLTCILYWNAEPGCLIRTFTRTCTVRWFLSQAKLITRTGIYNSVSYLSPGRNWSIRHSGAGLTKGLKT